MLFGGKIQCSAITLDSKVWSFKRSYYTQNWFIICNICKMKVPRFFKRSVCFQLLSSLKKMDFSRSFHFIYLFSRAFGQKPFTLVRNSNGAIEDVRVNIRDYLWFVTSICLYTGIICIYCYVTEIPRDTSDMYIFKLANYVRFISTFAFNVFVIISDMFNRFRYADLCKQFTHFDKEVISIIFIFNSIWN